MRRTKDVYTDDPQLNKWSTVNCSTRYGADREYDLMVIIKN